MKFSISRIKSFKACRRRFWLTYHEGLTPVQTPEPLQVGKNYHERIEALYKGEALEDDFSKECAMAKAYEKYIYPQFTVLVPEVDFEVVLGNNILTGRVDALAIGAIVEHKTTGQYITEEYEYDLQWDEQLLAYMLATGMRKCYYTVCVKPTIRQKKDETEEQFFERMVAWYDTDTDTKIRCFEIKRTEEEVQQFRQELEQIMDEINNAKCFYKNTQYCKAWGRRCEYAPICLNYDPNAEYVEFIKEERS